MDNLNPGRLLRERFGFAAFRPLQEEIITAVLARHDTLAVLPTGGGKSLCYQLPALLFPGLTVVVSPLISLMQDQVGQLRARGIPAAVLNSTLEREEYFAVHDAVRAGTLRLLYLAPETLLKPRTLELLGAVRVDCLTIDEAHCISEWGHDFRAEYRQLAGVKEVFPQAVTLALTATATPRVRDDIARSLKMDKPARFVAGFDRPNFFLEVVGRTDTEQQVLEFVREHPGQAGIVYCLSRKSVDSLAGLLAGSGIKALPYHAGLDDETRRDNQNAFIQGTTDVIVATIAFGMGIDKPDIRYVLHAELPQDLESYYQQIGRAGRDGGPARCRLLFSLADVRKVRYFIEQRESKQEQQAAETRLQAILAFVETPGCRRLPLLAYFGELSRTDECGSCDRCRGGKEGMTDATEEARLLLTCIRLTGERFGGAHLIDVLTGESTEKTERHGHERLWLWGQGRHWRRPAWQELVRFCLHLELVTRDETYGGLQLAARGRKLLLDKEPLFLPLAVPAEPYRKNTRAKKTPAPSGGDPRLIEALRTLRTALAAEEQVPAYCVFSNRTLDALAAARPADMAGLLAVPGIGRAKAEKYGRVLLQTLGNAESQE